MTNAEARFNKSLRPRKPEGSLGRTAQDVHLDSHTAPELCRGNGIKNGRSYSARDDYFEEIGFFGTGQTLYTNLMIWNCFGSLDSDERIFSK